MKQYKDRMFIDKDWLHDQLDEENMKQITKWGIQKKSAFEWLTNTAEELGSLAKAISEHEHRDGPKEKVVAEASRLQL